MSILVHQSHLHPLTLRVEEEGESESESESEFEYQTNECLICLNRLGPGPIYECKKCRFPVHKYCAQLPAEMNHPFHPHSLILVDLHVLESTMTSGWYKFVCSKSKIVQLLKNRQFEELKLFLDETGIAPCSACGGMNRYSMRPNILPPRPAYGDCEFNLDFKCAALTPVPEKFRMPAAALQHQHRFIACTNRLHEYHYTCLRCGKDCDEEDYIYICLDCKCLLHESCAALPDQIKHPLHPQHVLSLSSTEEPATFSCHICSRDRLQTETIFYGCSMCEFSVDIWCAKLEVHQGKQTDEENSESRQRQCHRRHSLIQCVSLKDFPRPCFACYGSFDDKDSIFFCSECHILLHASCLDPPNEIVSLFHPQHPLQLFLNSSFSFDTTQSRCNRCLTNRSRYFYACELCNFCLDIICATRKPEIPSSEIHEHPLAFCRLSSISRSHDHVEVICFYCHGPYDGDFALRCCMTECNYSIHPRCLPSLPESFKHDCHIHPLTLSRSCIKERWLPDEIRANDAKFYCYACEGKGNLNHPCYHCSTDEDCIFIAHVHCLIIKIVSSMQKSSDSSVVIKEVAANSSSAVGAIDDGKSKLKTRLTGFAEDTAMEKHASSNVETERASTAKGSMSVEVEMPAAAESEEDEAMTESSASPGMETEKAEVPNLEPNNIDEIDEEIAALTAKINQLRGKRHQILSNSTN